MRLVRATLQLTRPDSSILAFLAVLLPTLTRTRDFSLGLVRAVPLLFVGMCTFIINDLEDIERDKINHPERPLPSGLVEPWFAAVLYYLCLALALTAIRLFITSSRIAFLYYLLLIASISYGYVVEFLPELKPFYVSLVVPIPVLILVAFFPNEPRLYSVAVALGFFNLGRELCMDLRDRLGDKESLLHRMAPQRILWVALALQTVGLGLVSLQIDDRIGLSVALAMTAALALSYVFWIHYDRTKLTVSLMKLVLFLGLYFLL